MNNKNSGGLLAFGCVSALVAFPLIVAMSVFINGFVAQHLWTWFLVPLGLPAIGYLHAAGIGCLVSFLCPLVDTSNLAIRDDKNNKDVFLTQISSIFARPLSALVIGYVIHLFMA